MRAPRSAHWGRLVVAVDGRPRSWRALAWAADQAAAHDVPLRVVHCWQHSIGSYSTHAGTTAAHATTVMTGLAHPRQQASAVLAEAVDRVTTVHRDVLVAGELLHGQPATELPTFVRSHDMLVLGVRSRHRTAARLIGSTISHLVTSPPCTLALLPASDGQRVHGAFAGHVVAAVDGQAVGNSVLGAAFAEAAAHRWPLAVAYADPARSWLPGRKVPDVVLAPLAEGHRMLQDLITPWQARYPEVVVRRGCFRGTPADVLRHVATGATALVVGHPHRPHQPVRLLDTLLADLTCPVIVVP